MKLLTAEQMRELDRRTIEKVGIPGIVLMENASRGVFEVIASVVDDLRGKRALIVCGRGNNGGDGFAVARHLLNAGAEPEIALAASKKDVRGDAKTNLDACVKLKIPITGIRRESDVKKLSAGIRRADFIVDALLGTGVRGPVRPPFETIIKRINKFRGEIFAVDAPSGLSVDDGRVHNIAVKATRTATFGMAKIGLFVYPGAAHAGQVYIVDIGIPVELLRKVKSKIELTPPSLARECLKGRKADAHKGDCGKVLVVGGSRGMSGAPCMAGLSALRTGAGLVYLAVPKGLHNVVEKKFTEGVTLPMPESGGALAEDALPAALKQAGRVDAAILGPGIGVTGGTAKVAAGLLKSVKVPMVIDADALNVLAKQPGALRSAAGPVIITPHSGEMARLCGAGAKEVEAARLETATAFAKKHRVITLLKGAHSITASPDGGVYVNPTGNPGMATAGSGDVLSGIIGALAAGGAPPLKAAAAGAYLHGLAGDIAARTVGERSLTATDITRRLPRAIAEILK